MPFGASVLENGRCGSGSGHPASKQVDLSLRLDQARELPMTKAKADWFELHDVKGTDRQSLPLPHRRSIAGVPDPASRFNPDDVHVAECSGRPGWLSTGRTTTGEAGPGKKR